MELKDLLGKIGEHLSVGRAFGAAYEKDGTLIIPVAFVAGGGGGGGTDFAPAHAAHRLVDIDDDDDDLDDDLDDDEQFGSTSGEHGQSPLGGSGSGFGGVVLPVGVYVVKDDHVRWVPALNVTFIAMAALGVVRVLARAASKRH